MILSLIKNNNKYLLITIAYRLVVECKLKSLTIYWMEYSFNTFELIIEDHMIDVGHNTQVQMGNYWRSAQHSELKCNKQTDDAWTVISTQSVKG